MRQRRVFRTPRLYPPFSLEDRLLSNPRLALPIFIILDGRRKNGPVPRYYACGDDTRSASRSRFDCIWAAWPVRRSVPIIDPRSRDLRARGKAGRAFALGNLAAGPAVRACDYY